MEKRIFDFLDHKLSYEEREEFLNDVEADEELGRLYAEVLALRGLESLRNRSGDAQESTAGYQKFLGVTKSRSLRRNSFRIARYAAVVILVAAVSWLSVTNYRLNHYGPSQMSFNTVAAPAGQRVSVTLSDGSVVWLNSMSSLTYPASFAPKERAVRLEGEAYFEVARDTERPFVVECPKMGVRVLGTRFNVRDYGDRSTAMVNLVEGSVEVSDAGNTFEEVLYPGHMLEYADGRIAVSRMRNYDCLLWKDGIYAFENETLAQIAETLELYYDVTILIESPALTEYRYSGKFRQQDGVYEILRILQRFYRFSIERDDATRTITIK